MGDITLRAIDTLRAVPLVAAEDTRMTRRIWARHGIDTKLVSYHALSSPARRDELLAHLASGADLAIVTDAGTPLVSDPGADLVAAWTGQGGRVVPIPGASAVLAALVASGLAGARWSFEGFLPRRGVDDEPGSSASAPTTAHPSCSRLPAAPRRRSRISPLPAVTIGTHRCHAS